jgi:hypothetical protein
MFVRIVKQNKGRIFLLLVPEAADNRPPLGHYLIAESSAV